MDEEQIDEILTAVEESGPHIWLPILRTNLTELMETCLRSDRPDLAERLRGASYEQQQRVAEKLGDILMEGGDYWEGIPAAVERVMPS